MCRSTLSGTYSVGQADLELTEIICKTPEVPVAIPCPQTSSQILGLPQDQVTKSHATLESSALHKKLYKACLLLRSLLLLPNSPKQRQPFSCLFSNKSLV